LNGHIISINIKTLDKDVAEVIDLTDYPALLALVSAVRTNWSDHTDYIEKSLAGRLAVEMETSEEIAAFALKLAALVNGGLDQLCSDYRFLCEAIVLPEEIYFRRHGKYRLASFADANRECYANAPYMTRYMNGLLISNILWNNHARAITSYARDYLPKLKRGFDLLEIGPGHGLFLYFAARQRGASTITGWDVSPTSVEQTSRALRLFGMNRPVTLVLQNVFEAGEATPRFDAIVMSEILEHLEDPVKALRAAAAWLRPGGTIWVNVPANSPAPDHIYLVDDPEHACDLVRAAGLEVRDSHAFPMTGATLEKALSRKLAISCVVVGRKPVT